MTIDVHEVTADQVEEFKDKLGGIPARRSKVAVVVAEAQATLDEARASSRALAVAMSRGEPFGAADMTKAAHVSRDAEAALALAKHALEALDGEERVLTANLQSVERRRGIEEKKRLEGVAHDAAIKLDEASAVFNQAWEAWKTAREAMCYFTIPHSPYFGAGQLWSGGGPGWDGAKALHPEVLRALANRQFKPTGGSVANPRPY